jgi:hypothetical protein
VLSPAGLTLTAGWAALSRPDGTQQLTYNGWPLYLYAGRRRIGTNDGNAINSFGGVWSLARPGLQSAPATPQPTTTPGGLGC